MLPDEGTAALPARWKLGRLLGRGGQADVWLAQDAELGEWVAMKIFKPDLSETARERLRREVRLGHTLQHPHLVRVFELIDHDGRLAVVMEWVPGGSALQRLGVEPTPIDEVVRIADETLAALEYLHAQRVVHRDVKPSNLLFDADNRVRLADLGLARPLAEDRDLTKTATAVGTPAFMSPEQLRGEAPVPASDLYGLGATLFQLLTGHLPYEGVSEYEIASMHLKASLPDPRGLRDDCPAWLARFTRRLLEKRPEDRWPDAAGARRALHTQRGLTSPRFRRRMAATAAATVFLGAAIAAGGWYAIRTWRHPEAAKVEAVGNSVRGLDARGDVIWEKTLDQPVQQVGQVDFNGDGVVETIVSSWQRTTRRGASRALSEVLIVDPRGATISRIHPEEIVKLWPFEYAKAFTPQIMALTGAGAETPLLINCPTDAFYPTALLAYWPKTQVWETLLFHSGWIYEIKAVPGSSPLRLRFWGINNRLCVHLVAGELVVPPPEPASRHSVPTLSVIPYTDERVTSQLHISWYTMIDTSRAELRQLSLADTGEITVASAGTTSRLDGLGNVVPGPNAGRDLASLRVRFLGSLMGFELHSQARTEQGVVRTLEDVRRGMTPLLAEAPYRVVLDVEAARALARVGAPGRAIALLRTRVAADPNVDAEFRLANLLALAGDLDGAVSLAELLAGARGGDRRYDAMHLHSRLCVEKRTVKAFQDYLVHLEQWEDMRNTGGAATAALWARAHVWWDEASEADCHVKSFAYVPDGEAVACLARWRLGRTAPGDPKAMDNGALTNPETALTYQTARAAALLGVGQPQEALVVLSDVIARWEPRSHDDFMIRQDLDLARAVQVKALLAAGDGKRARQEARALRASLRAGLLPRILVDEVLRDAAKQRPSLTVPSRRPR